MKIIETRNRPHIGQLYRIRFANTEFRNEVLSVIQQEGGGKGAELSAIFHSAAVSEELDVLLDASDALWIGNLLAICTQVHLHSYGERLCLSLQCYG